MTRFLRILTIITVLISFAARAAADDADATWAQAIGPWLWSFPRDHGSHPDFRTEWWYFTGNLIDEQGKRYGYQLTFFRQGIQPHPDTDNPWSVRDLFFAHFTITDVAEDRFDVADSISRAGPGLAAARSDGLEVWILDWSAAMHDSVISLKAAKAGMDLNLELRPAKPLVLHGQGGLSAKGPRPGQASYYTSFTDLETQGFIKPRNSLSRIAVRGVSWFDHEFGSNQLAPDQQGWDWFSLHLSDGRDLMIYLLRKTDGSLEPASSGTVVEANGTWQHLVQSDITVSVLDTWKSPHSGGRYPARWRITIPKAGVDLTIKPLRADQELNTQESIGLSYWEGAVSGVGQSQGKRVSCEGYVELTGYAGGIGGVF